MLFFARIMITICIIIALCEQRKGIMRCQQCRRIAGDMVCQKCHGGMEELRQMKLKAAYERQQQLQKKMNAKVAKMKQFDAKLESTKKRAILLHKIKQQKSKNQSLRQQLKRKRQKTIILKQKIKQHQEAISDLQSQRLRLKDQLLIEEQTLQDHLVLKQSTRNIIIQQLHTDFTLLIRYLSMDAIQCCKLEEWQQFMSQKAEQAKEQIEQNIMSEEMALFVKIEKQSTQKLARHLVRSIRAINIMAVMHGVMLPYHTCSHKYRIGPSLLDCLYDKQKNRLNLSLLRLHQANTVYLYSRACITVHHPDVEEGRLQELHQTFILRLKGFRITPISAEIRKPVKMLELQLDNLSSIKVSEQQYEKQNSNKQNPLDQDELMMKEISQYFGFKSINSSEEDDIQILA